MLLLWCRCHIDLLRVCYISFAILLFCSAMPFLSICSYPAISLALCRYRCFASVRLLLCFYSAMPLVLSHCWVCCYHTIPIYPQLLQGSYVSGDIMLLLCCRSPIDLFLLCYPSCVLLLLCYCHSYWSASILLCVWGHSGAVMPLWTRSHRVWLPCTRALLNSMFMFHLPLWLGTWCWTWAISLHFFSADVAQPANRIKS